MMTSEPAIWIRWGSLLMFLAIFLGAFGAHGLRDKLSEHYMDVYRTGVLYHMIHALALFVVAYLAGLTSDPKIVWAGIFFLIGILLFSGSLYVLSVFSIKWMGAVTPLGGLCFMAGWLLVAVAFWSR